MLAHPGAEPLEDVADERIAVTGEAIVHPFPVSLRIHQAGSPQLGEMARDLRLIESQGAMEIADADLVLSQKVQEAQPGGIRQCLKEQLGLNRLWFLHRTTYMLKHICLSRHIFVLAYVLL